MLPVRVLLAVYGKPVADRFVIVDDCVKLCELVGKALQSLGFRHLAENAHGFIQIGSWRPLSFEQIADDQDEPAAKLLKPILHNAVLKIVVQKDPVCTSSLTRIDFAVTPAVLKENDWVHETLETTLANSDTCDEDDRAKSAKDSGCDDKTNVELEVSSPEPSSQQALSPELLLQQFLMDQQPLFDVPTSALTSTGPCELKMKSPRSPSPSVRRYDPMERPVKPCFDTIYEVPMLQDWYTQLKFPGKAQCQLYADELNSLSHRQTSPALSWQTVSNWFKNRRRQDRRKGVMTSATAEILE